MKQKLFCWGDDFRIKSEAGEDVFFVDGRAFSIGNKLSFQDLNGNELAFIRQKLIYQGGHRRWGIENKAFNELTQAYHLEHCYHHEPHSMLAQRLILILGFLLFTAFAQLHSPLLRLGQLSLKELAHKLDLALEEDLPWNLWFHCG